MNTVQNKFVTLYQQNVWKCND
ncbi:hypothetical protein VCHENC02_0844A, partial [Vibrio harveyi]